MVSKETLNVIPAIADFDEEVPGKARPLHAGRPGLARGGDETKGFAPVLARRDFRLLWAAQGASQIADKFLMFTLLIVVYELSHRSALQSLVMLAYTFPSVVFSAPAGVYADRHDKKNLMLGTNIVRGLLILLIPVAQSIPMLNSQVWPLLVITFAFSSVGQLFAPAEAASIPALVKRSQIMPATSLFMTTVIVSLVVGVPAATLTIRIFGQMAPFAIACGLFGIAAVCVWRIRTPLHVETIETNDRNLMRELREGLVILGRSAALQVGLTQLAVALVTVFTLFALSPAYMAIVLDRPSDDTYLVLIPATFGMVITALVLGQTATRIRRAPTMVWAGGSGGLVLIGIGLVPGALQDVHARWALVPAALFLSLSFGCALGGLLIPAFTVLQEQTTEESRGRIFGGIFTVINAAVAVPLLLAGGLADAFGVDRVVAGLGVILLLSAVIARTLGWRRVQILDSTPLA